MALLNDKIEKTTEAPIVGSQLAQGDLSPEEVRQLQQLRDEAVKLFSRAETSISIMYSTLINKLPEEVKNDVEAFKNLVDKFQSNTRAMTKGEVTALVNLTNKLLRQLESRLKQTPEAKTDIDKLIKILAEQLKTESLSKQVRLSTAKEAVNVLTKAELPVPKELIDLSQSFWASNKRFKKVADKLEESLSNIQVKVDTSDLLQDLPTASLISSEFKKLMDKQSELGDSFEEAIILHGNQISASVSEGIAGMSQGIIASIGGFPALIVDEMLGISDRIGEIIGDQVAKVTQKTLALIAKPFAFIGRRIRQALVRKTMPLFALGQEAQRRVTTVIRQKLPKMSLVPGEEGAAAKAPIEASAKEIKPSIKPIVTQPESQVEQAVTEKKVNTVISKLNNLVSLQKREIKAEREGAKEVVKAEKRESRYVVKKLKKELDDLEIDLNAISEGGGVGGLVSGLVSKIPGAGKLLGLVGKMGLGATALRAIGGLTSVPGAKVITKGAGKLSSIGAKVGSKLPGLGTKILTKEVEKATVKAGEKAAEKAAVKAGEKGALKLGGKALGKSLAKKLPLASVLFGAMFAKDRLAEGDILGAAGELASGVVATIPGIGTGLSLGIDALLLGRDYKKMTEQQQKAQAVSTPEIAQNIVAQENTMGDTSTMPIIAALGGEQAKKVMESAQAKEAAAKAQQAESALANAPAVLSAGKSALSSTLGVAKEAVKKLFGGTGTEASISTKVESLPSYTASLNAPEINRESRKTIADEFAAWVSPSPRTQTNTPATVMPMTSQGRRAADSPIMIDDLGLILLNSGVF